MNFSPLFVMNVSGSYLLSLSLLQAIPLPVAWKEDPSTLGQYHECAQTHPLLGDHTERALPPWLLPRVSSHPHAQSEDHRPGTGWRPQEHPGPQVGMSFLPQVRVKKKNLYLDFLLNEQQ